MSLVFSLIAPASYTAPETLARAAEALQALDITVRFPAALQAQTRYLAGDVEHRVKVLHDAYADPETDAIWAVRGGYGCAHLANRIDWANLPAKPLIGYSDVTVLLDQCRQRGLPAIHGPVMKEGVKLQDDSEAQRLAADRDFAALLALLGGIPPEPIPLNAVTPHEDAVFEGPLVGGNLAVLASLVGTPLGFRAPPGAIVVLEDVGEPYYRLERDLWQLVASGALNDAAAVCLGTFEGCQPYGDLNPATLFATWLSPRGLPLFEGLPVGHGRDNLPWRYGAVARLENGHLHFSA
ncbi:S66 peptidase family protein [Salinicola aestuarinus]|uniref:S66 peptidase family protein n=1 Tax=Salinicola aestuarinus TaxID=1949082 RepID=UPI000DA1332D|nr:LD-carboxypeptidase [Salinicola aestuarinus]